MTGSHNVEPVKTEKTKHKNLKAILLKFLFFQNENQSYFCTINKDICKTCEPTVFKYLSTCMQDCDLWVNANQRGNIMGLNLEVISGY